MISKRQRGKVAEKAGEYDRKEHWFVQTSAQAFSKSAVKHGNTHAYVHAIEFQQNNRRDISNRLFIWPCES